MGHSILPPQGAPAAAETNRRVPGGESPDVTDPRGGRAPHLRFPRVMHPLCPPGSDGCSSAGASEMGLRNPIC